MNTEPAERVRQIEKQFITLVIIDAPATVALGLGLYGKFVESAGALHPLLNNETAVNALLIGGAGFMIGVALRMVALTREKLELKRRRPM